MNDGPSNADSSNPMPRIRAVLLAGFVAADIAGLLYLALAGRFMEALTLNPLALFGALLGGGLMGMAFGVLCGLTLSMVLGVQSSSKGWLAPILVSGCVGTATGWMIAYVIMGMLS